MPSALEITLLIATVASGITAGVCFAFATFLMKAFDRLGGCRSGGENQKGDRGDRRSTHLRSVASGRGARGPQLGSLAGAGTCG